MKSGPPGAVRQLSGGKLLRFFCPLKKGSFQIQDLFCWEISGINPVEHTWLWILDSVCEPFGQVMENNHRSWHLEWWYPKRSHVYNFFQRMSWLSQHCHLPEFVAVLISGGLSGSAELHFPQRNSDWASWAGWKMCCRQALVKARLSKGHALQDMGGSRVNPQSGIWLRKREIA